MIKPTVDSNCTKKMQSFAHSSCEIDYLRCEKNCRELSREKASKIPDTSVYVYFSLVDSQESRISTLYYRETYFF